MKNFIKGFFAGSLFTIFMTFCFSCSSVKHIQRSEKDSTSTSKLKTEINSDEKVNTITDTQTRTTEWVDTTGYTKERKLSDSALLSEVRKQGITIDQNGVRIKITVDSADRVKVSARVDALPVDLKFNRTTVTDQKQKINSNIDFKAKINQENKLKTVQKESVKTKETSFAGWHWWYWVIIVVVILAYCYFKFRVKLITFVKSKIS